MTLLVTILGNNSALPAFGRHPTSQTVEVNGETILIDCGEGTQIQMQKYGIKWRRLNHILISHLHGDHYFGLPGLLNSMSLMGRTEPLHLYAPAPLQQILDLTMQVADSEFSYPFHFHPLPEGAQLLADTPYFKLSCFPVEHRIACHGFSIEEKTKGRRILPQMCVQYNVPLAFYNNLKHGAHFTTVEGVLVDNSLLTEAGPVSKRYAYCADTVFTDSYLPYIQGADTIYHESTYLNDSKDKAKVRFHCTAAEAAEQAKKANVKQLLLGHFSSKYKDLSLFELEAGAIFPNVVITTEGNTYEV